MCYQTQEKLEQARQVFGIKVKPLSESDKFHPPLPESDMV